MFFNDETGNTSLGSSTEDDTIEDEQTITLISTLKIPSEQELMKRYASILSKENIPSSPSRLVEQNIVKIHKLQKHYETSKIALQNYQTQFIGLKQSIESSINKDQNETEKTHEKDDDVLIPVSLNVEKILAMTSFAPYSDQELDSIFQQASEELQRIAQIQTEMGSHHYLKMFQFFEDLQGSTKSEPFKCTSSLSSSLQRFEDELRKQFEKKWKHIAKVSHLSSLGRETEAALLQRKEQYRETTRQSSRSFTSPLTPKGTDEVRRYIETKMNEISNYFQQLSIQLETLQKDRQVKMEEIESMTRKFEEDANSDLGCVLNRDDVESSVWEVLHEKRKQEISNMKKNDDDDTTSSLSTNLWWMIQSPLFYKSVDSLDALVDFLSGRNEHLDHFIDVLLEITSAAASNGRHEYDDSSQFEKYDERETDSLLGTNLKLILQKKLQNVHVKLPKEVEPYWKKSGILKYEWIKTASQTIHSIPDDPKKRIEEWGVEFKQWIENTMDAFS